MNPRVSTAYSFFGRTPLMTSSVPLSNSSHNRVFVGLIGLLCVVRPLGSLPTTGHFPYPPPPAQSRYTGRYGGGGRRSVSLAPRPDPVALRQLPRPYRPSPGHDQRNNVSRREEHKQRVLIPQDGRRTVEPGHHPAMTITQPPTAATSWPAN